MGTPASGDRDLMLALLQMRILTSSQLGLLTRRSAAVIRRRMRMHLIPDLEAVTALTGGGAADEKAYALTPKGFDMMAAEFGVDPARMPFSRRPPSGPGSPFYRHLRLTNDSWIAFHLACERSESPVQLVRAIPEWEMASDPKLRRSKKPWEKFIVSERVEDIDDGQHYHVVRPDAVFLFAPRGEPVLRVVAYLEADRATVSIKGPIHDKIRGYYHVFLRRSFERFGGVAMRVLFVVGSVRTDRRIDSVRSALHEFCARHEARHERFREERLKAADPSIRPHLESRLPPIGAFASTFRLCRREDFLDRCILTEPIWRDASGERVPFYRGETPAASGETGHEETRAMP